MLDHGDVNITIETVREVMHAGQINYRYLTPFGGIEEFETIVPALSAIHHKLCPSSNPTGPQAIFPDEDILKVDICTVLNILYRRRGVCSAVIMDPESTLETMTDASEDMDHIDKAINGWITILKKED
jgi:hypothetical protein